MKDNFSRQADIYAKYRPAYPGELFDYILSFVKQREAAWDCATGNGQSAMELSRHFEKVYATDTSQKQLDHAYRADNIFYSRQPAEKTDFADHSFDLVTVSQALHWFSFDEFYNEVKRVTKPGGWLAVWMYSLLHISPPIDNIIHKYHFQTLDSYWDSERKHVDNNYADVPFLPGEIKAPNFFIYKYWTLEELEGYFNTWSALQKFISTNNYSPVREVMAEIKPYWENESMKVVFPITLKMAQL